jgi:hypothetical protein
LTVIKEDPTLVNGLSLQDSLGSRQRSPVMDMQEFLKNRQQFSPDELAKYAGKFVAWSPDGSRILASDDDEFRLDTTIKASGHDPADVLVSFVPYPDEVILGGGGNLIARRGR